MIQESPTQQKLIEFKTKMKISTTHTQIDKVGPGCWHVFRKRHAHVLVDKKGQTLKWIKTAGVFTRIFVKCMK